MSPNRVTLLRPPFGSTRDLYRREDGRYGEDDPIQWPQPFNENNAWLACIPTRPVILDDRDDGWLWNSVSEQDMESSSDTSTKEGGIVSSQHSFQCPISAYRTDSCFQYITSGRSLEVSGEEAWETSMFRSPRG